MSRSVKTPRQFVVTLLPDHIYAMRNSTGKYRKLTDAERLTQLLTRELWRWGVPAVGVEAKP